MVEIKNPLYNTAAPSTQVLHAADHLKVTSDVTTPISVSTTFEYAQNEVTANNYGPDQRYVYAREGNPVMTKVESSISTLTEGHAVLYGSGLSALLAVLIEYKPKKIAISHAYFGVKEVIKHYQKVACDVVVIGTECSLEGVDLVWIESPVNPTGEVVDIAHYALRAHAAGALLVVDSTLAPPPLAYPFRQGADVVVHSATKYFGGHSDLLAGVVVTKSPVTAESLRHSRYILGLNAGNLETWLLERSLKTLPLRVKQQSVTTKRIVALLENHRRLAIATACHTPCGEEAILGRYIKTVQHASIQKICREFDIAAQHPEGFGAVFSINFATKCQAQFVARHLKLHTFATSLGGVESLVDWRHGWDCTVDACQLRISVGLESYEDLAADWRQALLALGEHEKKQEAKL